jgi:hypothetical protein
VKMSQKSPEQKVCFVDAARRREWVETVSAVDNTNERVLRIIEKLIEAMPHKANPEARLGALAAINSVLAHRKLTLPSSLMNKFLSVVTEDPHELIFDSALPMFKSAATNGHRLESMGIVTELRKGTVERYRILGGNKARRSLEEQALSEREALRQVKNRIGRARFMRRAASREDLREHARAAEALRALEQQVALLRQIERKAFRLEMLARL